MATGYSTGISGSNDGLANLSPDQWQSFYNQQKTGSDRLNSLLSLGNNNSSSGSSSDSSNSSSSSGSSNGLGLGSGNLDDYTNQAKNLAQFNLGLTENQSTFDQNLRNQDADLNLGRQKQLNDQTYGWQQNINNDTQNALSSRLNSQLQNNLQLQQGQIDQQNNTLGRAISLASTRLGGN